MHRMTFEVSAESYGRFMGRFARPLARAFADLVEVTAGQRVLDVGCGSGALTDVLVDRVGVDHVWAADPSPPFVESVRARFPAMDVRLAGAEGLPFPDGACDVVLAQLVVLFMSDPVRGIGEMARCTRPGGLVAANVWDHGGGTGPLSPFWSAARLFDPQSPDEMDLPGVHEGQLAGLFEEAGLLEVTSTALTVRVEHPTFEDWWDPFTLGVGPAGAYVDSLDPANRDRLRDQCRELLPAAPFNTDATAWVALART